MLISSAASPEPISALVSKSDNPFDVVALVPRETPLGPATVTLTYDGQTTESAQINIVPTSFGLFTFNHGYGPAIAENVLSGGGETNNLTHPAHRGQYVSLWGTGLGSATLDQVIVLLGGHPMPVSYAGPAPGFAGVDQINFQISNDPLVPDGCYVGVQVQVSGTPANLASLSTSAGLGACVSPLNLSAEQMAQLDAGGSIPLIRMEMDELIAPPPAGEWFSAAGFTRNESFYVFSLGLDASSLAGMIQPMLADDAFYACSSGNGGLRAAFIGSSGAVDLGTKLTLSGPGLSLNFLPVDPLHFIYQSNLPPSPLAISPDQLPRPYFGPGAWQLNVAGSAQVLPFQAAFTVPPPIQVTNFASLRTIARQNDLVVKWNPSGYTATDVATVTLTASTQSVACRVHATDGTATVPATLLQVFPSLGTFQISVTPRPDRIARVNVPLTSGGSVPGQARYSFTESFPVTVQ